ncbi:hypothetical protein B0H65DRAFT_589699 [Neurospora tetraspora]|uniref:Uncharacterized protein n=1 Tax=Neurospora tetraspora TaxID=94610 RepID=A0AAE0JCJ0_9PEZI|nr:hypothetical protein B0H65DRAFT_589699 [Neurospora tetraspora]
MPRTLATARGRCPQKAALKEQGINPNKLLSSSRVTPRRMTAESKPPRPRCRQTTEKIFQFALGEVHASDKSFQTESVPQPPKEEKAEAHREVKQEVVDRKRTAEKEIPTRRTMKRKIAKRPIAKKSIAKESTVKKKVVKREGKS